MCQLCLCFFLFVLFWGTHYLAAWRILKSVALPSTQSTVQAWPGTSRSTGTTNQIIGGFLTFFFPPFLLYVFPLFCALLSLHLSFLPCVCVFFYLLSLVFFHSILPVSLSASSLSCHSFLLEIIHFILPRVLPPFLHSFQLQFYSYAILTHFHPGNVSHRSIMHFIFCIFWNKIEGLELQFKYLAWRSILFKWRQNIFGELVNLRVLSSQK